VALKEEVMAILQQQQLLLLLLLLLLGHAVTQLVEALRYKP
jgi:hypothetical protein